MYMLWSRVLRILHVHTTCTIQYMRVHLPDTSFDLCFNTRMIQWMMWKGDKIKQFNIDK